MPASGRHKKPARRSGRRKSSLGAAAAAESASALAIWMADASSDGRSSSRDGRAAPAPPGALQACIARAAAREEAEFNKLACKVLEKLDARVAVRLPLQWRCTHVSAVMHATRRHRKRPCMLRIRPACAG